MAEIHAELGPSVSDIEVDQELRHRASQWIQDNPVKIVPLVLIKIAAHWGMLVLNPLLLVNVVLGIGLIRKSPLSLAIVAILVADTMSIAATYETGGRFLIPVFPCLYVLGAIAAPLTMRWLANKLRT